MDKLEKTIDNPLGNLESLGGLSAVLKKQAIDTFKGVMKRCLVGKFECSTLDFRDRGMPMFSFELIDDDVVLTVRREKGTLGSDVVHAHALEDILKNVKVTDERMDVTLYPHDSFEYRDSKGRNKEVELRFYFFRDVKFKGINGSGQRYTCMYGPNKVLDILNGKIKEDVYENMDLDNGTMKPFIG